MMLCLKEVKIDSKISNSLCLSKSVTHSVDRDSGGEGERNYVEVKNRERY